MYFIYFLWFCFTTTNGYEKEKYVKDMEDNAKQKKYTTNIRCKLQSGIKIFDKLTNLFSF